MIPPRDPDAEERARLAGIYRLATAWERFKDAHPTRAAVLSALEARARDAEEAELRRRFEAERARLLAEEEDAVYPRTRIVPHEVIVRALDPGSVGQRRPNRAERRAAARRGR